MGTFIGGGGGCSTWGLLIRSCKGCGSLTNAFSSNLKKLNIKTFANPRPILESKGMRAIFQKKGTKKAKKC